MNWFIIRKLISKHIFIIINNYVLNFCRSDSLKIILTIILSEK